jgi:hypothetical protein
MLSLAAAQAYLYGGERYLVNTNLIGTINALKTRTMTGVRFSWQCDITRKWA